MIRALLRHQSGRLGVVLIALLVVTAVFAPILAPVTPEAVRFDLRLAPPGSAALLGTDHLGRDILSRIMWGARLSILSGVGAILLGGLVGIALGLVAGYAGSTVDRLLMRVTDVLLAFPTLLLALMVVAILGPGALQTVIAIGIALVAPFARLTRGEAMRLREWEFVQGARAVGASSWRIVLVHVFPNIVSGIVVYATLRFGVVVLTEASLGFLGLGPSSPSPAWGLMVNEGLRFIQRAWWVPVIPGFAILFTVLATNLLGDALRDVLDPRTDSARRK